MACDSSAHERNAESGANVSILQYSDRVSRNHPCLHSILQGHWTIPRVSTSGNLDAVRDHRFLHQDTPRTRHVGLEALPSQTDFHRKRKDPKTISVFRKLSRCDSIYSLGHQALKCYLSKGASHTNSYTTFYAQLQPLLRWS
jgi:hypothetical protein